MKHDHHSQHRKFSHVYVEEDALGYPDTDRILEKFKKATVIPIQNYKEILNRSKQNWRVQKESQKLILAKRHDEFLYPGSDIAPNFSHPNFYYNALSLNCVYNCHYCYLQGMYPSAHTVVFVNHQDYLNATDARLRELGSMYLCLSYDTDLLAFEGIIPRASEWIEFCSTRPELIIEIRTKSVNIHSFCDKEPLPNVVFAWTLSPQNYIDSYEQLTPPLKKRLAAMKELAERGWKVRACIDPVLAVRDWREEYTGLTQSLFTELTPEMINDISIGTFRMPERYFSKTLKIRKDSELFHLPFHKEHGRISYPEKRDSEMKESVKEAVLEQHYPEEKVFVL